jgi:inner membrane protein involved in colicin E2 resistance
MEHEVFKRINKPVEGFGLKGENITLFFGVLLSTMFVSFIIMAFTSTYIILILAGAFIIGFYIRLISLSKKYGIKGFMQQRASKGLPSGIVLKRISTIIKTDEKSKSG